MCVRPSVCVLFAIFSKTVKDRNLILFATSPDTKGGGFEIETKFLQHFLNCLISKLVNWTQFKLT